MKKIITSITAALVFLALLSLDPVHVQRNDQGLNGLKLDGFGVAPNKAFAATTNDGVWEYVRGTASFVRNITTAINTTLAAINASPLVGATTYKGAVPGTSYLIDWNGNTSVAFTRDNTGALLGSATYTKSLRIFNTTPQLLIEMYFNAASDGGLLVRWMPKRINPALYTDAAGNGICEAQVSGAAGSRTMVCSCTGGPFPIPAQVPDWATALLKAQESGGRISITALTKTNAAFNPSGCGLSANYYFPLAYITVNSSPYNTTAKFGFNDGSISDSICGVAALNIWKYGLFNINANASAVDMQKYFYQDRIAAADIPSGYPTATDVDTLFSTIKTAGSGAGDIGMDIITAPLSLAFKNSAY